MKGNPVRNIFESLPFFYFYYFNRVFRKSKWIEGDKKGENHLLMKSILPFS